MSARRRGDGTVVVATTSTPRQRRFPSPRQIVNPKASPWPLPSKRQQTITQMPIYHDIFHPEQVGLEYEEEPKAIFEATMPKPKRRKLSTEMPPSRRVLRSAKKQLPTPERTVPELENEDRVSVVEKTEFESNKNVDDYKVSTFPTANPMPPPKTPAKSRQREIPSSQTPPDTPWSLHSRSSIKDADRSPLKDRSCNIADKIPPPNTPMRLRWQSKKEVADSMTSASTLSKMASKSSVDSLRTDSGLVLGIPNSQPSVENEDATQASAGQANNLDSVVQVPSSPASHHHAHRSTVGSPVINTNPVRYHYSQFDPADPSDTFLEALPQVDSSPGGLQAESQFEKDWHSYTARDRSPTNRPRSLDYVASSQSVPTKPPQNRGTTSPQLQGDRSPDTVSTQPLPPRSQTPQRKRQVPPSQATTMDITQASHLHLPSSHANPSPPPQDEPSSPLHTQAQMPSSPPPLPPVQETGELTSSQRLALPPSSSQIPPPSSQIPLPSSQLPSSSASEVRRRFFSKDVLRKYEWDGQARVRESQLFPESLMDDGLDRVPEGWGEVWGMEEEEEEEEDEVEEP